MSNWMRRVRGAFVMGVIWALGWGIIGGGLMEGVFDPNGRIADIWPAVLGIPGFWGGIIFSVVLAAAERNRRFEELSMARFGAMGAVAGALLGVLGSLVLGLSAGVAIPTTVLGALSATGSLALARRGERPLVEAGDRERRERIGQTRDLDE